MSTEPLELIATLAGAGAVLAGVVAMLLNRKDIEHWVAVGTAVGGAIGLGTALGRI